MKFNVAKLKKAVPIVLSVLSGVGVIATAVLSTKATAKALATIDETGVDTSDPVEVVEATWKHYIPTAVAVISTIGCIVGSSVLSHRQQVAILGAYAVISNRFKQYQNKVKDIYGEDAHKKIICDLDNFVGVEHAKNPNLIVPGIYGPATSLDWDGDDDETKHLFYEAYTGRYFTSTMSRVLQAEMILNRDMSLGAFVTINYFFKCLGLDGYTGGDDIGWAVNDSYTWIDFNHYRQPVESMEGVEGLDALEALVIEPEIYPTGEDCLY